MVEAAVKSAMVEQHGMAVQEGAILAEWQLDEGNNITELTFLTGEGTFTTACSVSHALRRLVTTIRFLILLIHFHKYMQK